MRAQGPALTIRLHKHLVLGVLLLTLDSKVPMAPLPADCIDLINEQGAKSDSSGHSKQVPDLKQKSHEEPFVPGKNRSKPCPLPALPPSLTFGSLCSP